MRKSLSFSSTTFHILVSTATLLWLLWYFIPVGYLFKGLITLLITVLAGRWFWSDLHHPNVQIAETQSQPDLSLLSTEGPIVLVCGDGLDTLFAHQWLRNTAQGCWLRVADINTLTEIASRIQTHQIGHLSVMYVCLPDQHQDEGVLRASFKALRQQVKQLNTLTGFTVPIVLHCEFFGMETPWVIVHGDNPIVCPENETPLAMNDWQRMGNNLSSLLVLKQAFALVRATLLDELQKTDRLYPPIQPFAVVLRIGAVSTKAKAIWSHWLYRQTHLQLPSSLNRYELTNRFPDALLPLLAPFAVPEQGSAHSRRFVWLLSICALVALSISTMNNHHLILKISADLQRWQGIPMAHSAKEQALMVLKQDVLLLERDQRQGEPVRYGLGLYQGQPLWLALQQAIDTYVQPLQAEVPADAANTVRLDSLSLFDPGKAVLKQGSTKILVDALMAIKAKSGSLIVVTGHTDSTGDAQTNQQLSLKRAEAVRDWMLQTSDVSPTCFAVQGYGASRPVANNDTEAGRAANRRVEISLVPQADACQVIGEQYASSIRDDVTPFFKTVK